jgi:hypothetical protein
MLPYHLSHLPVSPARSSGDADLSVIHTTDLFTTECLQRLACLMRALRSIHLGPKFEADGVGVWLSSAGTFIIC